MAVLLFSSASAQETKIKFEPRTIQGQGSFAVGGKVITSPGVFNPKQPTPDGQTLHGDHAYVFYQVPANPRKLPLIFLPGTGQFSKTWETTPDGRQGFQTIFLRRRFPVFLIDQPRRGSAGRGSVPVTIAATPRTQNSFLLGSYFVGKPTIRPTGCRNRQEEDTSLNPQLAEFCDNKGHVVGNGAVPPRSHSVEDRLLHIGEC